MARIRSIHPKLWTDEEFVSVSPMARLLLIGLLTEADDHGVFEWKPATIKMRLLPADAVDVLTLLEELIGADRVRQFYEEGKHYGCIRNFCKWQRPKKPVAVYPINDDVRLFVGLSDEDEERVSSLRKAKWEAQGGCCFYCREQVSYYSKRSDSLEIDHRIPLCSGGTDDDENLVASCRRCNRAKSGLSEADFRAKYSFANATEIFALPKAAPKIQREEGGDSKEKERSDPSDQAPSPPKQSSFLPEPEKPKTPYELARGDLLPLLAEMAGYADDANGRMKAGKLFNQLYGEIDKDLDAFREIVTRIHAKAETRDKGIACIKAEIASRKNTVRLVVDNEKPDPWGINAWCIAQGATPTQSAKEKSIGKWALHGRIVDSTARNIAKAAMLPSSWRGDWNALAGWVKDKISTDQIILAISKRCENPSYDPSMIRSIRFFDDNIRAGRRAA